MSGPAVERHEAVFPFGVHPEEATDREGRGPDTMNRLLLHAARYHDRETLTLRWERGRTGWGWHPMPDWRADRHAVRAALVLRQRLEVQAGETVALWLPLTTEFPLIERGVWSIGAVSVPVWPEWELGHVARVLADARPVVLFAPDWAAVRELRVIGGLPESVRATVLLAGEPDDARDALPFAQFMEYGGVLDTAERAAMWRTLARGIPPGTAISREYAAAQPLRWGKLDHRAAVAAVGRLLQRFPPHASRVHVLTSERPDPTLRALVYAGWTDGLTRTLFASSPVARARLGEFSIDFVAGSAAALCEVLRALQAAAAVPPPPSKRRGLLARMLGMGQRDTDSGSARRRARRTLHALLTDGAAWSLDDSPVDVQFVERSEIELSPTGPGIAGQGF